MKRLVETLGGRRRRSTTITITNAPESEPLIPSDSTTPQSATLRRTSSTVAAAVCQRLVAEVIRKLNLAIEADQREDRDIICGEVFADITGELNTAAKESTGAIYKHWYEVLAPYLCKTDDASNELLEMCRHLWGQPYTAPIYALLLHQWLLVHPEAGGVEERLKLLNILVSGARQLFSGDIESGTSAFKPLFTFIAEQVVLLKPSTRLDALPHPSKESVMAVAAAFLPYYYSANELLGTLEDFPAPASTPFPSPRGIPPTKYEQHAGADFAIDRIVDALSKQVRNEPAVLKYLNALVALKGSPYLADIRTSTRIRLQGELYALTQSGGPRYASRAVNRVAFHALDSLFPHGRRTRRAINLVFRFLHPQEWPWMWWDTCGMFFTWVGSWIVAFVRPVLHLLTRRRRRGVASNRTN